MRIDLDNDVYELLEDLGKSKSSNMNIKIAIATALFTSRAVSLGRAANITEMAEGDFMEILNNNNIPWGEYDKFAVQLDDAFLNDMR